MCLLLCFTSSASVDGCSLRRPWFGRSSPSPISRQCKITILISIGSRRLVGDIAVAATSPTRPLRNLLHELVRCRHFSGLVGDGTRLRIILRRRHRRRTTSIVLLCFYCVSCVSSWTTGLWNPTFWVIVFGALTSPIVHGIE